MPVLMVLLGVEGAVYMSWSPLELGQWLTPTLRVGIKIRKLVGRI